MTSLESSKFDADKDIIQENLFNRGRYYIVVIFDILRG